MTGDFLADRGKGLEDAFFARQDALLRQRLAELDEMSDRKVALAQASGIADAVVLDRLMGLGMSSALLAAISLVPLVTVAWADGQIEPEEREVVLASAERSGLDKAHPGYALFAGWLDRKPQALLFETWTSYMAALLPVLSVEARRSLETDIVERSRAVAEAAGGFLRIAGRTSAAEKSVLANVERVLAA
ncbi:MAG TPA: hypothetical protein VH414_21340 [Lichenihabitans sp.]|jgi:hypothetical protein|nr:hypothetical protein [Lichenihabitans sp.]